jgi:hypothetical protein
VAEVDTVGDAQKHWAARARGLPGTTLTAAIAWVKKSTRGLKNRYGPRYTKAMLSAAFFAFFLPVPGGSLVGVALVVVIAEVHRAIATRGGLPEVVAGLVVLMKANMPRWATGRWSSPPR